MMTEGKTMNCLMTRLHKLHDELHRDGYGANVDRNLAHVRDVLDELISILRRAEQEKPSLSLELNEESFERAPLPRVIKGRKIRI